MFGGRNFAVLYCMCLDMCIYNSKALVLVSKHSFGQTPHLNVSLNSLTTLRPAECYVHSHSAHFHTCAFRNAWIWLGIEFSHRHKHRNETLFKIPRCTAASPTYRSTGYDGPDG
jgi:hypothetical protein